jgi:hypothetical protein
LQLAQGICAAIGNTADDPGRIKYFDDAISADPTYADGYFGRGDESSGFVASAALECFACSSRIVND